MRDDEESAAPGLRWNSPSRPLWRATKSAIAKGYPVKTVNLAMFLGDPSAMRRRCIRLQAEMNAWLSNRTAEVADFDGSIRSLLALYETDPESPFHSLSHASKHPYEFYIKALRVQIGEVHVDHCDGRDLKRWFAVWSEPEKPGGKPRIARARMMFAVLRAALTFGVLCRKPGCAELRVVLGAMTLKTLPPRTAVVTAADIDKAREHARTHGHPGAALAYALQFEGAIRQWDVIGQWVPLSDPRFSEIIFLGRKWIGPTWAHVDQNMILRFTPSKTARTSAREVVLDLKECPMVMDELEKAPPVARNGPMIIDINHGRPYRETRYKDVWRAAATAAGLPKTTWNRDLRAGGITEGRAAAASIDDLKKVVGHSQKSQTTGEVYDRAHLEAHRRVAQARISKRGPVSR